MGPPDTGASLSLPYKLACSDFSLWMHNLDEGGVPWKRQMRVEGEVPAGLRGGSFLRNGPANFNRGTTRFRLIDGDGFVVAVRFDEDGSVHLGGRFVETPQFLEEQRAQQSLYRGVFGTRSVLMRRNYLAPDFKNTANTNTLFTDGRLFALWEGGKPQELDPQSLETVATDVDMGGAIRGAESFSAHPQVDRASGHVLNIGADLPKNISHPLSQDCLLLWEFDARMQAVSKQRVPLHYPFSVMHDFAITEDYAVMCQCPLSMSLLRVAAGQGVANAMSETGLDALIYVVRRKSQNSQNSSQNSQNSLNSQNSQNDKKSGGSAAASRTCRTTMAEVAVFRVPALYSYHCINAFQRGSEVVLDLVAADAYFPLEVNSAEGELGEEPFSQVGGNQAPSTPRRVTVDLAAVESWDGAAVCPAGAASVRQLWDHGIDMITLNPNVEGKAYKFAYAVDMAREVCGVRRGWAGLLKLDVGDPSGRSNLRWTADEPRTLYGDPQFVAALTGEEKEASSGGCGAGTGEDHGWLLSHTFDPARCESAVVVLDAATMELVAKVTLDTVLPLGFHTNFMRPSVAATATAASRSRL